MEKTTKNKHKYANPITKKDYKAQRILLIGPSQAGKSTSCNTYINHLLDQGIYTASRLVIFSATFKTDDSVKQLRDRCIREFHGFLETNVKEDIDLQYIQELYNIQKRIKEERPKKLNHYLIYYDDVIGTNILTNKGGVGQAFLKINSLMRHYNISSIMSLQQFKAIDRKIRNQFSCIICHRLQSQSEVDDLADEYSFGLDNDPKIAKRKFVSTYMDTVQQDDGYRPLVINTYTFLGKGRFQSGVLGPYLDEDIIHQSPSD